MSHDGFGHILAALIHLLDHETARESLLVVGWTTRDVEIIGGGH